MVSSQNFIQVQGWMVTELGLSGNELLCYALIYGFSQDGESTFSGSSRYICEWLSVSKQTALTLLSKLCEKGYIEKIEKTINNVLFCEYRSTLPVVKKFDRGGQKIIPPLDNNIYINNINKKETIKEKRKFTENFETFWKNYPKQRIGSKDKAYTSYCRVLKENRCTEERLLEAVKEYAYSDEVRRGYAKGCAAWLNDDRFNTEYTRDNPFKTDF